MFLSYVIVEVRLQFPQEQRVWRVSLRRFINIAKLDRTVNTFCGKYFEVLKPTLRKGFGALSGCWIALKRIFFQKKLSANVLRRAG